MRAIVRLKIIEGPMQDKEFVFRTHDTFLLGRSSECHVSLPEDGFVSRHHFLIEINPPEMCLRDLGSMNGTYVNQVLCGGRNKGKDQGEQPRQVDLKDGDRVQVGATVLSVQVEPIVSCARCGSDIPRVLWEECAWRDGTHLCMSCRVEVTTLSGSGPIKKAAEEADVAAPPPSERRLTAARLAHGLEERYTLERKLGEGGMGSVYLARRKADDRQVAIKILRSKAAIDERMREAFLREAEVLGALKHPHIVNFEECGGSERTFHFVMEYCATGNITRWMEQHGGTLPLRLALAALRHSLQGLAHAHKRGYVHRDIKPSNLLVLQTDAGRLVKISDFGLAKSFEGAGLSGMTATGTYGGTLPFMPREQLTHFKYIRPVSDVWSMAATFYSMVTGHYPREAQPGQDPVSAILQGAIVPIRDREPSVPQALAEVVDRALSNNLEVRYQSAGDFLKAVRECQ